MTANNAHDGQLEQQLAAHYAAGNGNVPPTPDLWAALHAGWESKHHGHCGPESWIGGQQWGGSEGR